MKNKFLGLALAGLFMAALPSVAQATDVDALVNFVGSANPAGRFYFPVNQDMRLVTAVSITNPSDTAGKEMGYQVRGGLEVNLPLIGVSEITGGLEKTTVEGSDTLTAPIKLTKNAVYNITKDVKIGVSVDLISIGVDAAATGGKYIGILNTISPVVGTTIRF